MFCFILIFSGTLRGLKESNTNSKRNIKLVCSKDVSESIDIRITDMFLSRICTFVSLVYRIISTEASD